MKRQWLIAAALACASSVLIVVLLGQFPWPLRYLPAALFVSAITPNLYLLVRKKHRSNSQTRRWRYAALAALAMCFLLIYVGGHTGQALSKRGCFLVLDFPLLPEIVLPHPYDYYVFHTALMFLILSSITTALVLGLWSLCIIPKTRTGQANVM